MDASIECQCEAMLTRKLTPSNCNRVSVNQRSLPDVPRPPRQKPFVSRRPAWIATPADFQLHWESPLDSPHVVTRLHPIQLVNPTHSRTRSVNCSANAVRRSPGDLLTGSLSNREKTAARESGRSFPNDTTQHRCQNHRIRPPLVRRTFQTW